jgi:predicted nucleic acid-binding Zn ribbon protein
MNIEKKKCLVCEEPITGRSDKKFCCDQCRTTHFNRQNADQSKFMRNINNILRKNRRILEILNPNGKTTVTKTDLLDEGFKFAYFTNEYKTKAGKTYRFCYEQGYVQLEGNLYALVFRKEYVD